MQTSPGTTRRCYWPSVVLVAAQAPAAAKLEEHTQLVVRSNTHWPVAEIGCGGGEGGEGGGGEGEGEGDGLLPLVQPPPISTELLQALLLTRTLLTMPCHDSTHYTKLLQALRRRVAAKLGRAASHLPDAKFFRAAADMVRYLVITPTPAAADLVRDD